MAAKAKISAKTIDDYLARLPADQRLALEKLRRIIQSAAPGVEECISYQLAAFRHHSRMLVAIGATPRHCAFYLMSSSTAKDFKDDLTGYATSTGTIRFQAEKPLPASLVRKLVKARIAENAVAQRKTRSKTPKRAGSHA